MRRPTARPRTSRLLRPVVLGTAALVVAGLVQPSGAAPVAPAPAVTSGCVSSVPEPGSTEPTPICYSLFRPAGASAAKPVPMLLHSHGWGGSRTTDAAAFGSWLQQGFGILSFDQRGFGESGGKAHIETPALEGRDVIALVDLVTALPWVRKEAKGDPLLGAIGGSYGGGYQYVGMLTEQMLTGRTRFDALAPEITWFDLKESLAPQEVPRTTWIAALYAAGLPSDAHTTDASAGLAYSAATGQWPDGTVPGVPDLDAFFEKNGPRWHLSQGRRVDVPVLFNQGATDNLFPLTQGLSIWERSLTAQARLRSIFVGYNGGHALPNVAPAGEGPAGNPCAERLAGGKGAGFTQLAQRFMAEQLLGRRTGLTGYGQLHLATVDNTCSTVRSVAPRTAVELGTVLAPAGVGAPLTTLVAAGPVRVAGRVRLDALVTTVGADVRSFFALAVGTTPADAVVVQNNVMPHRELLPVTGAERSIELPSVAVDVPAGSNLYLVASPVSDMFVAHGSRTPGVLLLQDATLHLATR